MSSIVIAALFSLLALGLGLLSMRQVLVARTRWEQRGSSTPAAVRWLWAATVACCALTALMLLSVAWINLGTRGMDSATEGSLCARIAFYTAGGGYALVWLASRLRIRWPQYRHRGPLLLPPARVKAEEEGPAPGEK